MWYRCAWLIFRFILKYIYRWEVKGRENEPKWGALIIATNHQSFVDPGVLGASLKRKIYFMAKEELFHIPLFSLLIKIWGAFPIKRGKPDYKSIEKALQILKEGKVLGMFPEGMRSINGRLQKAKSGVAHLALKGRAPILPVALSGTDKALPKGKVFLRLAKVRVSIGKPIYLDEFYNREIKKELVDKISEMVMREIEELTKEN